MSMKRNQDKKAKHTRRAGRARLPSLPAPRAHDAAPVPPAWRTRASVCKHFSARIECRRERCVVFLSGRGAKKKLAAISRFRPPGHLLTPLSLPHTTPHTARALRQDPASYYLLAATSASSGAPGGASPPPQQQPAALPQGAASGDGGGNRMPIIDRAVGGYDPATLYAALGSGINVPIAMGNPMLGR